MLLILALLLWLRTSHTIFRHFRLIKTRYYTVANVRFCHAYMINICFILEKRQKKDIKPAGSVNIMAKLVFIIYTDTTTGYSATHSEKRGKVIVREKSSIRTFNAVSIPQCRPIDNTVRLINKLSTKRSKAK